MLFQVCEDYFGVCILIKIYFEIIVGYCGGYYQVGDGDDLIEFYDVLVLLWILLEGVVVVYILLLQLGFEVILVGYCFKVFGILFYVGWGLIDDVWLLVCRQCWLICVQFFVGVMILVLVWYDLYCDCLCLLEDVISMLEVEICVWWDDYNGWVVYNMCFWKCVYVQWFFGGYCFVWFGGDVGKIFVMIWGIKGFEWVMWVEDGFL